MERKDYMNLEKRVTLLQITVICQGLAILFLACRAILGEL